MASSFTAIAQEDKESQKVNMESDKAKAKRNGDGNGNIVIKSTAAIDEIIERDTDINRDNGLIDGYRVQIFFGSGPNSKQRAMELQSAFKAKYADTPDYLLFHSPHFKVRVGDFKTRLEALQFQKLIENDFPGSFVVKDEITGVPPEKD